MSRNSFGKLCSAVNCNNFQGQMSQRFPGTKLRFHSFPKDVTRSKEWLINIRRADLDGIDASEFYAKRKICSDHFEDFSYNNQNDRATSSLRHDAKPTLIDCSNPPKLITPTRKRPALRENFPVKHAKIDISGQNSKSKPIPIRLSFKENIPQPRVQDSSQTSNPETLSISIPSSDHSSASPSVEISVSSLSDVKDIAHLAQPSQIINEPRKSPSSKRNVCDRHICYKHIYLKLRKVNLKLHGRISRLKKKIQKLEKKPPSTPNFPPTLKRFIDSQHECSSKKMRGNRWTGEDIKLSLAIFYKSPGTYKFLRSVFFLPSNSVLYREISASMANSGICSRTMEGLKHKLQSLPARDSFCSLVIDGMRIEQSLQYMSNDCVYGFEEKLNGVRTCTPANELLVFVLQGIASPWKQIIAYYFVSSPAKDTLLSHAIREVLQEVGKIGGRIKCIILDQEPSHQKLCNDSGEICDIPVIFDPPHLLKNTRNSLLSYNIDIDGNTVKWDYIKQFFELDQRNSIRMAPKLKQHHICPNSSQKMKVKFASQVLSNTVSAGVQTLVDQKYLPTDAIHTAQFCKNINDLFDILNSSDLRSFYSKRPLTARNKDDKFSRLTEIFLWMKRWRFVNVDKQKTFYTMPFQKGWFITIRNVMKVAEDCLNDGFKFILTRHLNQDCVENLFSIIRAKGGYNSNPTLVQARSALRARACYSLLQAPARANCESIPFQSLLPSIPKNPERFQSEDNPEVTISSIDDIIYDVLQDNTCEVSDSMSSEAIAYVSGYIIRRFIHCPDCSEVLSSQTPDSIFIVKKTFKNCSLVQPSKAFTDVVKTLHKLVFQLLSQVPHLKNISEFIFHFSDVESLRNSFVMHCSENSNVLFKNLIRFYIRVFCIRKNEAFKDFKMQRLNKLKKLISA